MVCQQIENTSGCTAAMGWNGNILGCAQLHSGTGAGVWCCAGDDLPGASCNSPISNWQGIWAASLERNDWSLLMLKKKTGQVCQGFMCDQMCIQSVLWGWQEFDVSIQLQGYIAARSFWDSVADVMLPALLRYELKLAERGKEWMSYLSSP